MGERQRHERERGTARHGAARWSGDGNSQTGTQRTQRNALEKILDGVLCLFHVKPVQVELAARLPTLRLEDRRHRTEVLLLHIVTVLLARYAVLVRVAFGARLVGRMMHMAEVVNVAKAAQGAHACQCTSHNGM